MSEDGESSDDEDWENASKALGNLISQLSVSVSPTKKLLILLDMNGTLLLRSKVKLPKRAHECKILGNFCYFRKSAREFCQWLATVPDVDLCFYTSMKEESARPLSVQLIGDKSVFLFDQTYNKRDSDGEHTWSMMRDLERLWQADGTPASGHTERDTLMIDDSFAKMRHHPDNVFIVKEYTEEYITSGFDVNDDTLERTKDFLQVLLQRWQRNAYTEADADIRPHVVALRREFSSASPEI